MEDEGEGAGFDDIEIREKVLIEVDRGRMVMAG